MKILLRLTRSRKVHSFSTVAAKVIANADAGHSSSQDVVRSVAIDDFNAGALDSDLEANAIPLTDATDPYDPSIPFDPSSILAAIESLKSSVDNLIKDLRKNLIPCRLSWCH